MYIGSNIDKIRRKWGISQKQLAAILGVGPNNVTKYEKGENKPKLELMLLLEEITSIPVYRLCKEDLDFQDIPSKMYLPETNHYDLGDKKQRLTVIEMIRELENRVIELNIADR